MDDSLLRAREPGHQGRERSARSPDTYTGPGYRVQVFSSNDFKTAKSESAEIERQLRSTFPEQGVYRICVAILESEGGRFVRLNSPEFSLRTDKIIPGSEP